MKPTLTPRSWFILLLILALALVACERPLQDDAALTLEPLAPTGEPIPGYPGAETPAVPGLLSTPTSSAPLPGDEETETPGEEVPEAEPTPSGPVIHTVVAGDTLGRLAAQYGVTIEDIAAANGLTNIHALDVGQQLTIPIGGFVPPEQPTTEPAGEEPGTGEQPPPAQERVHTVQPGETLFRIGQQYGFTVDELAAYNQLANPNRLDVGQQIRIPPEGYTVP